VLKGKLEGEGIRFILGADIKRADGSHREINLELADRHTVNGTALLVAAGKKPNLASLGLDAAGVPYGSKGIGVDNRCRTGVPHIFAAGDVTGRYHFTHMSEHMAKTAVTNALLKVPARIDDQHLPWVTFTDPELAHVGATEADLIEADTAYEIYRFPYSKLDRAGADGRTTGMIVVLASRWRGKILGASVLGARAGELIGELALGMRNGITLRQISDTIHAYPTYGLGVRRAADQWYVRRRYPGLVKTLKRVFGFRGPVIESDTGDVP
jgi:pyruvate/2-oxoglutarate dehydrogenase complex dihydrolipoamide dehydrogenase (E3) component